MTESNAKLHTPPHGPVGPSQSLRAATPARVLSKQVARYSTVTDLARLRG